MVVKALCLKATSNIFSESFLALTIICLLLDLIREAQFDGLKEKNGKTKKLWSKFLPLSLINVDL